MAQDWYYTLDGQQKGPVDFSQLQQFAAARILKPGDLVCGGQMTRFEPASKVPGLGLGVADESTAATSDNPPPLAKVLCVPEYGTAESNYVKPSSTLVYAGFILRFMAYLVDGVILLLIMIPVLIGYLFLTGAADTFSPAGIFAGIRALDTNPIAGLVLRLLLGAVTWIYFAYQESSQAQATLGKRFLGIVVTDTRGQRISLARASGRHFGKIISGITFSIGYLMAAATDRKQALHDLMAGCLVVMKPG